MEHTEPKEQVSALQSGLFFVFDVESVGLYGDAFAVGWVVVDATGQEHDSGLAAINPIDVDTPGSLAQPGAMQWVRQNVPQLPYTHYSSRSLYLHFWDVLQRWWIDSTIETYRNHPKVLSFWADWASPVESNFLARTAQQAYYADFVGDVFRAVPAPLHEIATLRLAAEMDHGDPFLRVDSPEHNPLADARHSARILVAAMKRLPGLRAATPDQYCRSVENYREALQKAEIAIARQKAIEASRQAQEAQIEFAKEDAKRGGS